MSHCEVLETYGAERGENDALVIEVKPRLLLQHSCPDPKVSN